MTIPRKKPTLKDMLAAALRELLKLDYEHAKLMSADQVISLVEFHHIHYHAEGHGVQHWNLDPLPRAEHKARTPNDIRAIARTKRLSKANIEFQQRLLTPRDERPPKQSRWGSRPFQKRRKP